MLQVSFPLSQCLPYFNARHFSSSSLRDFSCPKRPSIVTWHSSPQAQALSLMQQDFLDASVRLLGSGGLLGGETVDCGVRSLTLHL